MASASIDTEGVDVNRTYPLAAFRRATGMRQHAMRVARKNGLPVFYVGNLGFVRGSDFAAWLGSRASGQRHSSQMESDKTGRPDATAPQGVISSGRLMPR
jgi:hypothetical protein